MKLSENIQNRIAIEIIMVNIIVIIAMGCSSIGCYFLKTDFSEGTMLVSGAFLAFFYVIRGIVFAFCQYELFQ